MPKTKIKQRGFTLIELIAAMIISAIAMLSVGVVLLDSQRQWNTSYNRLYSSMTVEGNIAKRTFESIVRKAKAESFSTDSTGQWMEVRYYSDDNSITTDRYAKIYSYYQGNSGGQLKVEHGIWNRNNENPRTPLSTQVVCSDVAGSYFRKTGNAVQMVMKLYDGEKSSVVMSSAVMHN